MTAYMLISRYKIIPGLLLCLISLHGIGQNGEKKDSGLTKAIENISLPPTSNEHPVSMQMDVYPGAAKAGDIVTSIIKVKVHPGWHIYARDPSGMFIVSEVSIIPPATLEKQGKLIKPRSKFYPEDPNMSVYKGEFYFLQKLKVLANTRGVQKVQGELFFQTCNKYKCLMPATISRETRIETSAD